MKTKTFALALLTSVLAVPSLAGAQVVIGPGVPVPPPTSILPRFVGVGISGATGKVYAFKPFNVASAGHNYHLADILPPYRYTSPYGWIQTAGLAADRWGYVRTFFIDSNGNVRLGTGSNTSLAHYSPPSLPYVTLPSGRQPSDIIDIAIRKSDNRVFVIWKDGKYTFGTNTNVASYAYNFNADKPISQIAGLDFDRDGLLVIWYKDGTYSRGRFGLPGSSLANEYYVDQDLLHSTYDPNPNDTLVTPPTPPVVQQAIVPNGLDASIAPGHRYIGVALDSSVYFYDRDGSPLSGGAIESGGKLDVKAMFDPFVRNNASTPSNALDVNNYLGMRDGTNDACEWTPTSTDPTFIPNGFGICVCNDVNGRGMGAPYDTRVLYDRDGQRFIVVAQLRNQLWTRYFSKYPNQKYSPETPDATPTWTSYYRGTPSILLTNEVGKEARRVLAFAISKTSDPREGWDTYVYAHNIVKDWPFAAVDGDWLVLSHRDPSTLGHEKGTIATLVSLVDLRFGRAQPRYVRYDQKDLPAYSDGTKPRYVEPAQHLEGWDRTILVSGDLDDYAIYTLPHPTQHYGRRPAVLREFPSLTRAPTERNEPERSFFRNGILVTASHLSNGATYGLRIYKLRLQPRSDGGVIVWDQSMTDVFEEDRFKVEPMPMINDYGDVSVVFGQRLEPFGLPTIRAHNSTTLSTANGVETTLHIGTGFYDTAVTRVASTNALVTNVDPVDDRRFFYIHHNGNGEDANGAPRYQTVIGSYLP